MVITHNRYLLILAAIFSLEWVALAIDPFDRHDWLLENGLVFIVVAIFLLTYKRFTLSRISITLIFLFLCLHEIGAHYTYSNVPYNIWTQKIFGTSLNSVMGWERNHFDRFVHFSYGFLLAYPVREVFLRIAYVRGFWGYFLPLDVTMSTSMIYELIEWGATIMFGGDLGAAYLGAQGDPWDAQKDMFLATLGAVASMTITATINIYLKKDFAREWAESLRVKKHRPLGEDEMRRLWRKRDKD